MLGCAVAAFLVAISAVLSAAEKPASPAPKANPAISAEQVKKWVTDLDSERFFDREVATEKLIAAGAVAVDSVVEAVASNNLEVTRRGIYILQELALSVDPGTGEAAHNALKEIAESRDTATARRAAATLAKLDVIRHDRALDELKRLGANVRNVLSHFGIPVVQGRSIEFDENWRGQKKDLARLGWLRDVDELIFQGPRVNDECLKYVPKVSGLQNLTIKRAEVTDEGIKHLRGMKRLKTLALWYLPVTDESVQTLKELQGFEAMKIYGCQMTPTGANKLRLALTSTDVDYRQGGFLGAWFRSDHQRCVVHRVNSNSAAQKAGLIADDVIYEYEGKRVSDYESLTAQIAKNRPGDKVTLKIIRNDQKLTKELTLGEWE
jgi:hypothetical protein